MSYSLKPVVNAFKASAGADAKREIGDLMRVDLLGEAIHGVGEDNRLLLPLTEVYDPDKDSNVALQVGGIAKVRVEAASGIMPGVAVSYGTTGVGIAEHVAQSFILGIALAQPAGDDDLIPVLLTPHNEDNGY